MRTNADWRGWGAKDPLYGVATLPDRAGAWSPDEFLDLGRRDWALFRPHWLQYGVAWDSCVEVGCGAGRMTAQLALEFGVVDAVDVSPGMLEAARRHVAAENVRFHLADGLALPLPDASASAAFSVHVFQHFGSRAVAEANFREIHRVLAPGGTAMVHLPIVAWPYGRFRATYSLLERGASRLRSLAVAAKRGAHRVRLLARPPMVVSSYEVDWLDPTLARIGFVDLQLRVVIGDSAMARVHPFVLVRKA